MFRIEWLGDGGKRRNLGGTPMFAPGPVATIAGEYVAKHIWPQIHRDHPELSGFVLVHVPSLDEVFRWTEGHDFPPGLENQKGRPAFPRRPL